MCVLACSSHPPARPSTHPPLSLKSLIPAPHCKIFTSHRAAAEWRRTLDRLSRIGNRPLINLSTESVAAAIKSAVGDRRGTLGLKIRRRDGESDGAGQQAIKNHSGLGRKAQIPEEEAAAAVGCADGESGEVDNKAGKEERVALRRAVRDTVLAMRGLAEVSPLSVADR